MFIETIAIAEGKVRNASYHTQRMFSSAGLSNINLEAILKSLTQPIAADEYYKLRLEYNNTGIYSISLAPYSLRPVKALKLIQIPPELDYSRKYADRSLLEYYGQNLGDDTIPLLIQNKYVTDTTYTNICFRKIGHTWVTPSTPLLRGTMRQALLELGHITEGEIKVDDISRFNEVALINAMIPLGQIILPVASVNFGIFDA